MMAVSSPLVRPVIPGHGVLRFTAFASMLRRSARRPGTPVAQRPSPSHDNPAAVAYGEQSMDGSAARQERGGSVADVRRTAGAVDLLRSVGLMADGPVRWGAQVRSTRPGVYLIELPGPLPRAPIDLSPVGTWIERVPTLELDGTRPAGRDLAHRLGEFWLPDQVVLYVGATDRAVGRRVDELVRTPLGDAGPHPDGRWLATLRGMEQARVWWAETDAPEEYEDALLAGFAEAVDPASAAALRDPTVVVPFANMSTPTGLPKDHGIAGDLLAAPPATPEVVARRVVTLPPGNAVSSEQSMTPRSKATGGVSRAKAEGTGARRSSAGREAAEATGTAAGSASSPRASASSPRTAASSTAGSRGPATRSSGSRPPARGATVVRHPTSPTSSVERPATRRAAGSKSPARHAEVVHLTQDGLAALQAELDDLVRVRRPEIIARVRAARELGDLSENADYESARKEQSFAEGRIGQLEAMIRNASIIEAPSGGNEVVLGGTVVVDSPEGEETFTIVGSSEARPGEGRISNTSPLGSALLGRRIGDDVIVKAPAGERHYRIVELR